MQKVKPSVYLETTIPSYLTARPSMDVLMLGHQLLTRSWWENESDKYEIHVSELVMEEVGRGDPVAAGKRLEVLADFSVLTVNPEVVALTEVYLKELPIPAKASADATHLALASIYQMDYLLTWNCRHIANALVRRLFPEVNAAYSLPSPTICTPEELCNEDRYLD